MSKTTSAARRMRANGPESRATSGTERNRWGVSPIECKPWCWLGDGHPNETHRIDQICYTEDHPVDLTLHDLVARSVYDPDEGRWVTGPYFVNVDARQNGYETQPEVRIYSDVAGLVELRFTTEEARQLIEAVQSVLAEIGGEQ